MKLTEKKHLPSTIAFFILLAAVVTVFSFYFRAIVWWSDYPDFGYSFRSATGLSVMGVVTKHGAQAGLQVGDRILKNNGKDYANVEELRAAMNRELGEENTYLLEREGQQFTVIVQNISCPRWMPSRSRPAGGSASAGVAETSYTLSTLEARSPRASRTPVPQLLGGGGSAEDAGEGRGGEEGSARHGA